MKKKNNKHAFSLTYNTFALLLIFKLYFCSIIDIFQHIFL